MVFSLAACSGSNGKRVTQSPDQTEKADTSIQTAKAQKALTDSFISQHRDRIAVWVKTTGSEQLQEVQNEQWPEEIEVTYNLVKDTAGRLLAVLESPYSQSGDWYLVYTHYFDQEGRTFAFTRQTNFFNSGCTEGAAYETITEYYNPAFQLLAREYVLVDENDQPLDKGRCSFPYDAPYTVQATREQVLARYGMVSNEE